MLSLSKLEEYYEGETERVGFVLTDGSIVECQNVSETPEDSFEMTAAEIVEYCDRAAATWHTHPNSDNNLSYHDFEMFITWENLEHYIIGNNGVRKYIVENGDVLIA